MLRERERERRGRFVTKLVSGFASGNFYKLVFIFLIGVFVFGGVSAVDISSCPGATLESNTVYNLVDNIVPNSTTSRCFDISGKSNVTIGGNGFSIVNTTFNAPCIRVINSNDVLIYNITLTCGIAGGSDDTGVYISGTSTNTTVDNVTFVGNSYALVIDDGDNILIRNSNLSNSLHGAIRSALTNALNNLTITGTSFEKNANQVIRFPLALVNNLTLFNNSFINNTMGTQTSWFLISLGAGVNNFNISNNLFLNNNDTGSGATGSAISISNGTLGHIHRNNFSNNNLDYIISLSGNTNNSLIFSNNISCDSSGSGTHGIILREFARDNLAYDNYVENCDFGMLFHNGAVNNTYYRNILQSNGVGLYIIDTALNNTAYNLTINGSTSEGVNFYHYSDRGNLYPSGNFLYNLLINNSRDGLVFTNLSDSENNLTDFIIEGSSRYDVSVLQGSVSSVIKNMTYNLSLENVDSTSLLTRKWYLYLGSIQEGILITLTYENGTEIYSNTTVSDLMSFPVQTLTAYINDGGTATNETYTITASKSGYVTNTTTFNLTDNTILNFTLVEEPATPSSETSNTGGSSASVSLGETENFVGKTNLVRYGFQNRFDFGGEEHKFILRKIDRNLRTAEIDVYSDKKVLTLNEGSFENVDLDGDGEFDLVFYLEEIYDDKVAVDLRIEKYNSEIGEEVMVVEEGSFDEIVENESGNLIWVVLGVGVLLIVGVIVLGLLKFGGKGRK